MVIPKPVCYFLIRLRERNDANRYCRRSVPREYAHEQSPHLMAIALGICLPAAIEELPIRMGLVCARVVIPNRRPFDPPFEVLPIEKLMVQYAIDAAAEVGS
ncbi:hypothetical protein [Rivularia sp. UHCC 0363]|uniref:hypothetical protein n=1 Tax=Rivularia sp. UHCC 0363 TaxID=3110244 RepID=UPI002B21B1EC|nr:hypothetical protein [Rivularia sp. UHCC 0363]MEA5595696.1 hypothetical protein [Rivularia sp. UHCC 0363]